MNQYRRSIRYALIAHASAWCTALTILMLSGFLSLAGVMAQQGNTPPRGFDYWQPDWMIRELWGPGRMPKSMMVRLLRHQTYMHYGVPKEYASATSTLNRDDRTAISAGRDLYTKACASCHGLDGLGGGKPASAVTPSPALLAFMISRPISVDEYMLWTISDGGKQFDSQMPAFKDKLKRDEIWKIIEYMRSGFPPADKAPTLPPNK